MIYVRELVLVDESDNMIYKSKYGPADEILANAIKIVNEKDGKTGLKKWIQKIDKDLAEYFNLGG